jgi:uncharacterized integral membrane protein
MRLMRFFFLYVVASAFGIALFLVLAQNVQKTRLVFYGREYSISLALVLIGAAVFGGLLMLILLLPGRLAANVNNWRLEREIRQVEQELVRLQERRERLLDQHAHMLEAHDHMLLQHQRLIAEHSRVVAERDQVRKQLIIASTTTVRSEITGAGKRAAISQSSTVVAAATSTRTPSSVIAGPGEGRAGDTTSHIAPDAAVHTAPHKAARDAERPVAHAEHQPAAVERALVPFAAPRTPAQPVREQPSASVVPTKAAPAQAPKQPTHPPAPVAAPAPVPVPATVPLQPAVPTFVAEQRAKAARAIRSQAQQLNILRDRLREDLVGVRGTLEAQVERLKQSTGRLRGPSAMTAAGSDDQGQAPRDSDTSS